jgi:hypothetical protein
MEYLVTMTTNVPDGTPDQAASTDPMPIKIRTAQTWEFCMHDP